MTVARTRHRGSLAALRIAASLLLACQAGAQEEVKPPPAQIPTQPAPVYATALETYLERPGIMLVKRYHPLAPVELRGAGRVRLDAIVAHEPGMLHQRMMGLRVEVEAPDLADEERVFYVDVHEIEELVRAIGFMMSPTAEEESAQRGERTEMSISSRDDLELGVVFAAGGARHFLRTPSASFTIEREALEALRVALDQARQYLFSH